MTYLQMIEGLSIFAKYAEKDAAVGGVGFNSEVMLGRWLKPISEADQARLRELGWTHDPRDTGWFASLD